MALLVLLTVSVIPSLLVFELFRPPAAPARPVRRQERPVSQVRTGRRGRVGSPGETERPALQQRARTVGPSADGRQAVQARKQAAKVMLPSYRKPRMMSRKIAGK